MTIKVVNADAVSPQPWQNHGGYTRELLAWPSAAEPLLRISLADIDSDGPFSAFAGMQRWFMVLEGAGVELDFGGDSKSVTPDDPPLHFDGAAAPRCRLLDGGTRDLNLMHRCGSDAAIQRVDDGAPWRAGSAQCGLFAAVAGTWHCADGRRVELPARSLLWLNPGPAESMHFDADHAAPQTVGWWLAFTPAK